jgi:hypothetical protein
MSRDTVHRCLGTSHPSDTRTERPPPTGLGVLLSLDVLCPEAFGFAVGELWITGRDVGGGCEPAGMLPILRSDVPIGTATELSVWWAEVLSEDISLGPRLSILWLDPSGHRLGRTLSVTGVPPRPNRSVIRAVLNLHDAVTEGSANADGHVAVALSRPGEALITGDDDEWAEALRTALGDRVENTWSLHLAAGGWITPVVDPPATRFHPRRIAWRAPGELLDRTWLSDHNSGHDDSVPRRGEGPLQPGHR